MLSDLLAIPERKQREESPKLRLLTTNNANKTIMHEKMIKHTNKRPFQLNR